MPSTAESCRSAETRCHGAGKCFGAAAVRTEERGTNEERWKVGAPLKRQQPRLTTVKRIAAEGEQSFES